jgi:hypothetical protein
MGMTPAGLRKIVRRQGDIQGQWKRKGSSCTQRMRGGDFSFVAVVIQFDEACSQLRPLSQDRYREVSVAAMWMNA